ncbi:hypothetical protein DHD05_18230 [Arenibacter sp. N53]|uniref:TauD/TfdA family dioxygenase n=1 Tax=Arenibacter TaxID=178469 RepID=UPI000CD3FB56|nr:MULTISPECIES: TauD/TfdA family dioxygenase [Arenibacter]MCM4153536.1 hypothetical protein [Arenibacter sp. N53]
MTESEYFSLKNKGWTEFGCGSTDIELITIASEIGNLLKHPNGQIVYTLKPKLESEALKGTFSNIHGYGDFPFHTDTAFYKKPARYILMHSVRPSICDTTVLSKIALWDLLTYSDKKNAERAIYLVNTNREKYYTSLIFRDNKIEGIKYDPSCMLPFNKFAKDFDLTFKEILTETSPNCIKWTENKTLIIDNWKCLHGRKSVEKDCNRELKRIYIN